MPDDYRISELDSVVTITNGDLVELSTVDGSSESGYTSVKATITQLADKILKGIQFATDLDTENKTIIGAINELKVMAGTTAPTAAQGVDGNLYIQYTAGTGGADDVIDGLYIKLDGAWCEISTGGGGSGGHEIIDNSGTALTQRTNLQFKGAYSEDNSGDDTTEVNVVRSMTKAQYNQLSSDEKVGMINVTDEDITATDLPISANDPTDTKSYIDTGLSGKADTNDTYTKSEIDNFLNGNVKLAYWSSQAISNYSIPLANLRSASGRDYGMAIVFAWKEIFAFHYDSNANLPVYNLTQGGNRTMTAAYNSSTQSIDLTFSGGNVWYGIGVLAI